jgi:hypothetical protein
VERYREPDERAQLGLDQAVSEPESWIIPELGDVWEHRNMAEPRVVVAIKPPWQTCWMIPVNTGWDGKPWEVDGVPAKGQPWHLLDHSAWTYIGNLRSDW